MARTKTVAEDDTPVIGSSTNGIKFDYDKAMNAVEVAHKLSATELSKEVYRQCALSTGNLMMDLMMGGGIQAAWNTIWGGEGSCKTTTVESTAANIMQIQVPLFAYFDYEQAMDPEYFQNILDVIDPTTNHDKIFGVRNLRDPSKWDLSPRIRYYAHDVGEDFYLSMGQLLRALPDKRYVQGKWYYVFPNTRQGRADAGANYDKKLYQKWKEFFVEAHDGGRLQMIMVIDSVQAMNPEAQEDNDPTKQLAQDAAMHGRHLKKVRGKLRRKHCAVLAIGQLRQNPGARFQNPEYTPGGNTLKHASDVRQKHASRSSPNGSGPVENEASVLLEGGTDTYKYINIKNEKNKFYTPHTEGWARVWGDHEGNGRGFCPVYDCVTGDTKLITNKGMLRIDEVLEYCDEVTPNPDVKNVMDIKGLKVLSNDNKFHKVTRWANKGKKPVYEIRLISGQTIRATSKHKMQVLTATGDIMWKEVKDLAIDSDFILTAKDFKLNSKKKPLKIPNTFVRQKSGPGVNQFTNKPLLLGKTITLTEDLAYLMGYLITDGTLAKDGKAARFYTSDPKMRDYLESLLKSTFNLENVTIHKYKSSISTKSAWVVATGLKEIHQAFVSLGVTTNTSEHKITPWSIWQSPVNVVKAYMRGLVDGDGTISGTDYVTLRSSSASLVQDFQYLLNSMGIHSIYHMGIVETNISRKPTVSAGCQVRGMDGKIYKDLVGLSPVSRIKDKSGYYETMGGESKFNANTDRLPMSSGYGNLTVRNLFLDEPAVSPSVKPDILRYRKVVTQMQKNNLVAKRIVDIVPCGYETVYDIEVEGTHNFIGNTMVVHNCFLFMACTGRIVGRLGIDKGQIPKKFQMHWPENGINNVAITWWDFKALVLYNIFPGYKKELKELCTQLGIEKKGKLHNPKIRERAFEDIKSGKALDLFQAIRVGGFVQEVEANEEDDDDEYALDLEDE